MVIVGSTPINLVAAAWCRPTGALRWQVFGIKPFDKVAAGRPAVGKHGSR